MRINTNVPALNTHRTLVQTGIELNRSIGRLSSGFRINRAADDAAGLAIANRLAADIRSYQQAARNAEQANSVLQIAEGATNTIKDILVRMKELATQAASDNVTDDLRANAIDAEFQQLIQEIDRIADSTNFQGTNLLTAGFTGDFQIGPSDDTHDRLSFSLAALSTTALGLAAVTDTPPSPAAAVATKAAAQDALGRIDDALDTVGEALGTIGATQNRLDYARANINTMIENFSAAESVIRDADMAAEMITLTRNQILQQSGTAMLAQANASPQLVLRLLG